MTINDTSSTISLSEILNALQNPQSELNKSFNEAINKINELYQQSGLKNLFINIREAINYIVDNYAEDIINFLNVARNFAVQYQQFCIKIFDTYFTEENLLLANKIIKVLSSTAKNAISDIDNEIVNNVQAISDLPSEEQNNHILDMSISIYFWITNAVDEILNPYNKKHPTLKLSVTAILLETVTNESIYHHFSEPVQNLFDIMSSIFVVLLFRYGWILLSQDKSDD